MRKLNKSELKRVYGASDRGKGNLSTDHVHKSDTTWEIKSEADDPIPGLTGS